MVLGYSTGAPVQTCYDMVPGHSGESFDPLPYMTNFNKDTIYSDDILTVTLSSSNKPFKGFLFMAFKNDSASNGAQSIGTFSSITTNDNNVQLMDCSPFYENAVTHANPDAKQTVSFEWIPPEGFDGYVTFKATFVEAFDKDFWSARRVGTIRVIKADPNNSTTTEKPDVSTISPPPEDYDIYSECGETKGCFGSSTDCIGSKSCPMLSTYKQVNPYFYQIEIYGSVPQDSYLALGFSDDKKMGGDSVIQCVYYRQTFNAYQSYNTDKPENNIRYPLESPANELFTLNSASYVNGLLYCNFSQPANYVINTAPFNLNESYYLLMAKGRVAGQNTIQDHSDEFVSEDKVNLAENGIFAAVESRILKQLHGSFMVTAWLISASIGVMLPRYMKKTWVGKQLMGKDMWFALHRGLMVFSWTLTVTAFILIFVDIGGWVNDPISENPHPLIGCITTGLAFIQPFMAAMRPLPSSPKRYIFNWAHLFVGHSAHILAITCIFLAVEMDAAQLPYYTYWVLTAHICCYVVTHLILSVLAKRSRNFNDMKYTDRDEKGSLVRKMVFSVFACTAVGLAAAVVAFIASS